MGLFLALTQRRVRQAPHFSRRIAGVQKSMLDCPWRWWRGRHGEIDCEISGITAIEFARIIHKSGKWQATGASGHRRIAMSIFSQRNLQSAAHFLLRRSVWREELSKLFANFKRPENDGTTLIPPGAAKNLSDRWNGHAPALRWTGKRPQRWRRKKHGNWQEKISQLKSQGAD